MSPSDSDESVEQCFLKPSSIINDRFSNENLLPAKSKNKYLTAYDNFISWREGKQTSSFDENVLLAYFGELANKYKSSTLWAIYSMLKMTLKTRNNVKIEKYSQLTALLRRKSEGHVYKKSKVLTEENIKTFIDQAPDDRYLATKVALILGVNGALRRQELADITTDNIENHGELYLIKIPNTKNKIPRSFVVQGKYYNIMKKYHSLRSNNGNGNRFFQNYRDGKCSAQYIGINKFGQMPKQIAKFLNLPDANLYTCHSFRSTSATLLADSGAGITTSKRRGDRKSNNVAEGYIEVPLKEEYIEDPLTQECIEDSLEEGYIEDSLTEGYIKDPLSNKKRLAEQIAHSILKSEIKCESTAHTNIETEPQPSTSGLNSNAGRTSRLSAGEPEHSEPTTNIYLSQNITLPDKNITLNFNNCTVNIIHSHK